MTTAQAKNERVRRVSAAAIYRALVGGIILFWVIMTGLLVRAEFFEGSVGARAVPVAHVFKQIFLHEQPSDLAFYRRLQRLGLFHVQPRRELTSPAFGATHALFVNGGSTLDFFGLPNQRVILRATVDLDAQQSIRHFEVSATVREPRQKEPSLGIAFDGAPPANHYHYVIRRGDAVQQERAGTPEELLDDPALRAFGFDPQTVIHQAAAQAGGGSVEARRSTMPFNNEIIDTYLVTFRGVFETTMQTTEQGQILAIKTGAGYDFYDETIPP